MQKKLMIPVIGSKWNNIVPVTVSMNAKLMIPVIGLKWNGNACIVEYIGCGFM